MAGHFLLAVLSLIVYFHVACSAVTAGQMLGALVQFSNDFTWPRINQIAAEINYTGFTPDVIGRVDVTNSFQGNELNTEYIFGLFSSVGNINTTRLLGVPGNATITELAITPPIISFSSIRSFDWGPVTIPIEVGVWFLFDNNSGLIAQYDITFRRLQWAWEYIKPFLQPQLVQELGSLADNPNCIDDLMHLRAAIDICQQHEQYCTGSLQQYNSTQACIDYIYHQTPLGQVYEWGGDTAMCRYIHKGDAYSQPSTLTPAFDAHTPPAMIPRRPAVHCPHIGPSGGGMCIKRNYINETTQNLYPTPFLPLALG